MRKGIYLSIFILLISIIPVYTYNGQGEYKRDNSRIGLSTIIVDQSGSGDYTRIQDAINASINGDTILIKAGIYHENLFITKSICINSFNSEKPVIITNNSDSIRFLGNEFQWNDIAEIKNIKIFQTKADRNIFSLHYYYKFNIENCTFYNGEIGICTPGVHSLNIVNSSFFNMEYGLYNCYTPYINLSNCRFENISINAMRSFRYDVLSPSNSNRIIENVQIKNCNETGIYLVNTTQNIIIKNSKITDTGRDDNGAGIYIHSQYNSDSIQVENCNLTGNPIGIDLDGEEGNKNAYIEHNIIRNNDIGISVGGHYYKVRNNDIMYNDIGLKLSGSGNIFYNNRMIDNTEQVIPGGISNKLNDFYKDGGGNLWSDYLGSDRKRGENQDKPGSDGFGDLPYIVNSNLKDMYPIFIDTEKPVAYAGEDVTIDEGTKYFFTTAESSDDQMVMEGIWEFEYGGEEKVIDDLEFEYLFDYPGEFPVTLTVFDFAGNNDTDEMIVTVLDIRSPNAVSQGDLVVDENSLVQFSGFSSNDTGVIEWYEWIFEYDGKQRYLKGMNVSYRFEKPCIIPITLRVTDTIGNFDETTFTVTVRDLTNPEPDAGEDLVIDNGETVIFDGSGSKDNGMIEYFNWTFMYDYRPTLLEGKTTHFKFDIPGEYEITLTVTDQFGNYAVDIVNVTVIDTMLPIPIVTGSKVVMPGSPVNLSASSSTDNHRVSGIVWAFYDPDLQTIGGPRFNHIFLRSGWHTIELIVYDPSGNSANISFQVEVIDSKKPFAYAGSDLKIAVKTKVEFNASGSTDDGEIVKYEWKITDESGFRIDLEGMTVEYTFESVGTYNVVLSVIDSSDNIGSDTMVIEVVNTGTLNGKVLDKSGDPIAGAKIIVTDSSGNKHTATSGSDGSFSIDVPAGSVTWEISASGYDKATGSASITVLESSEIDNSKSTLNKTEKSSPIFIIIIILVILVVILLIIGLVVFFVIRSRSKEGSETISDVPLTDEVVEDENNQTIQEPLTGPEDSQSDFSLERSPDEPVLQDQEGVFGDYNLPGESYDQSTDESMINGSGEEKPEMNNEPIQDLIIGDNEMI